MCERNGGASGLSVLKMNAGELLVFAEGEDEFVRVCVAFCEERKSDDGIVGDVDFFCCVLCAFSSFFCIFSTNGGIFLSYGGIVLLILLSPLRSSGVSVRLLSLPMPNCSAGLNSSSVCAASVPVWSGGGGETRLKSSPLYVCVSVRLSGGS